MSPVHEILVEESVIGWKEFELEVMRDCADNFVVICSIENIDPMGVHTGDSITVAPALTLTDKEYQRMRDAARRIIRRVGVETGGSNIQFAINPADGRMVAIEMNPRVSRSSALASKATGFPIAKIAAKLALGYRLDEIPNDITRLTPASFEPTIDYVVVKVPRWAFEKFPQADRTLTTQMKSVGEAMAIGRTFKEAFLKAFRSLELGRSGLLFGQQATGGPFEQEDDTALQQALGIPTDRRMWAVFRALDRGWSIDEIHRLTHIDRWFLTQFQQLVDARAGGDGRRRARSVGADAARPEASRLRRRRSGARDGARRSHRPRAPPRGRNRRGLQAHRHLRGGVRVVHAVHVRHVRRRVRGRADGRPKVVILGSGPNRIGQGIEFDYCCCHAAFALRDEGYETVMVNCNPETVSTDYDTVDRLYFEPLTFEDVLRDHRAREERRRRRLLRRAVRRPDAAEARARRSRRPACAFSAPRRIPSTSPRIASDSPSCSGTSAFRRRRAARRRRRRKRAPSPSSIGFPVVVRPSYVLGGRAMAIVYDMAALDRYMRHAVQASPEHPILIDKFLEDATEIDVDCLADATGAVDHRRHHGAHRAGRHPFRATARASCRRSSSATATSRPFATTRAASRARSTSSA